MYFYKELAHRLDLEPRDFDSTLQEKIEKRLRQQIEGRCLGSLGYVITVLHMHPEGLEEGLLSDVDGTVTYNLKCDAIVCRPFLTRSRRASNTVNELGFCFAGPIRFLCRATACPGSSKWLQYHAAGVGNRRRRGVD